MFTRMLGVSTSRLRSALTLLVTAVIVGEASACSCVPPSPTVCTSDFAITGTIMNTTGNAANQATIRYTVLVDDVIRDQSSSIQLNSSLIIATGSHSCGFPDLLVGSTNVFAGLAPMMPPRYCPAGMTYNECGSGCGPATCARNDSAVCPSVCVPGCYCDGGLVKEVSGGNGCIRRQDCPAGSSTTLSSQCPAGMTYTACGSGCGPAKCNTPISPICPTVCVPGCFCDGGLVKEVSGGSRCIRRQDCPAYSGSYSISQCKSIVMPSNENGESNGHEANKDLPCSAHTSAISATLLVLNYIIVATAIAWNV